MDLKNRRFNGYDLRAPLKNLGYTSNHGSFRLSESEEPWAHNLAKEVGVPWALSTGVRKVEEWSGFQNHLQFWSSRFLETDVFKQADVIHLHIIHDHWLSLETVRKISQVKPTVWTWHDLWPVTGHCTQPSGCARWGLGCGSCPMLDIPLPVKRDRTAAEYKRKQLFLADLDMDIHVSTEWMRDQVSPHIQGTTLRLHVIPFGLREDLFVAQDRTAARKQFGLGEDKLTIVARHTKDPLKQWQKLEDALARSDYRQNIQLVGFGAKHADAFERDGLSVYILPWIEDSSELSALYSAADIVFQASMGESFGFIAAEAMLCSRPVITARDTATAEVVAIEELEVDNSRFEESLQNIMRRVFESELDLETLGNNAKKRARKSFSEREYAKALVDIYSRII